MSQQAAGSRSPLEHADHTMGEESEDSWASGSVRVTVRWPESPRPPCPVIPGCAERWGQGAAGAVAPGSVQSSLPGLGRYIKGSSCGNKGNALSVLWAQGSHADPIRG